MRKWLPLSLLIIVLVGLGVYVAYQTIWRTEVTASPVTAQVFLDGKYVGNTPYALQTFGKQSFLVELKAAGFFPVSYQFKTQNHLAQKDLAIKLVPIYYRCSSISEDWSVSLCDNTLFKLQDPSKPLEVSRLSHDQSVYYTVLSPDGKLIAYATQGPQYNKFWLFSLDHPEDVTQLFADITTDTALIRAMPLQFSPNSQWIVYTGQSGPWIVAPVTHPQDAALKVENAHLIKWSKDGQWLAIFLSQEKGTEIYHYTDNRWTLYTSTSLPDQPVAFSFDNRYLFTEDWYGSNWLNVFDIAHQMQLVQHYSLEGDSDQLFNPIESLDGRAFAIAPNIYDSKTRIQTGILLFGRFDNDLKVELKDDNYAEVLYWLEGDKQVATLVESKSAVIPDLMKIVDVPADLLR